jgi:excisionase family DNA binding protein
MNSFRPTRPIPFACKQKAAPAVLEHPGAWPEPVKEVPTMQAYATAERLPLGDQLHTLDRTTAHRAGVAGDSDRALIDQILSRLADLVVERLMERTAAQNSDHASEWLDARSAAEYLGIHRDTLRKLAAQRAIPTHQDGPGCKLYFRRDELDEWRRTARPMRAAAALRAVS